MKKQPKLLIIIIVILSLFLTLLSIITIKNNAPYKSLEANIVEAMKIYYGQDTNLKKLPSYKESTKVTLDELESFGLTINKNIKKDKCNGYGIVKKEDIAFEYKAYIKCNNYKTKGYSK